MTDEKAIIERLDKNIELAEKMGEYRSIVEQIQWLEDTFLFWPMKQSIAKELDFRMAILEERRDGLSEVFKLMRVSK